ncbi:uncharacterized protein PGTG_09867 [Puccinia graminis f. sp. tritici CRL 75-36-700-3]|uniref:Uncharacterized protein n=1 Tax=Puccinia graminis f. sp. tritici (strain CRL 75-36-700-3 / race SCCL) TaxID=418459 RepID=E3KF72_PUCGT|nr:uncharacterized protein PGTG_09867 [Puccinia graminis f. sp. tritici CRL 75-36-700-3]EFP82899.1 hypothetical protein PGTG_09867 [Puccinia graminis f. sp. tritici CRL 75-36-700-3]
MVVKIKSNIHPEIIKSRVALFSRTLRRIGENRSARTPARISGCQSPPTLDQKLQHTSAKELRQRISGRPIVYTALINRPRSGHCPLHQYLFKVNHRLDGRPNPYYFISSLNLWGRG